MLERLWQLYRHDLSEFRDSHPDEQGLFKLNRLETVLDGDDPDRRAYLFYRDDRPVGFVLVGGIAGDRRIVDEFFVVRSQRRQGVAREAVERLFALHPGAWGLGFQEANAGAARFWRGLVGDRGREELIPVPGKPWIPHDVWLTFTV